MPLADDVRQLRDDTLADLDAGHDYYALTKDVWRIVQQIAEHDGREVRIENEITGTTVTEDDLPGLAHQYVRKYLASATFQDFVSMFEGFFFGLLRRWLIEYPDSLEKKQVPFHTVLNAADRHEIIQTVVDMEVNSIGYGPIAVWFEYLNRVVKLGCPTGDQIQRLAEIKASRDILVHNKGVVNSTYLDKAGESARFHDGDMLEVPERYHRESWELIRRIVTNMADAAIGKASP